MEERVAPVVPANPDVSPQCSRRYLPFLETAQKNSRAADPQFFVTVLLQEMPVARDDGVRAAAQGSGNELVVIGILADRDSFARLHPFCAYAQSIDLLQKCGRRTNLAQDVTILGFDCLGEDGLKSAVQAEVKQRGRCARGFPAGCDKSVGIEDDAYRYCPFR